VDDRERASEWLREWLVSWEPFGTTDTEDALAAEFAAVRLPLETALRRIANEPLDAEEMATIAQRALTGSECGIKKEDK
jgi:hypothetical protein